jgi:hypothetical protein
MPFEANPEIPQSNTPEESEQTSPIETAEVEAAGERVPTFPRVQTTPTMKVQS